MHCTRSGRRLYAPPPPFLHQTIRNSMLLNDWLSDWCDFACVFLFSFPRKPFYLHSSVLFRNEDWFCANRQARSGGVWSDCFREVTISRVHIARCKNRVRIVWIHSSYCTGLQTFFMTLYLVVRVIIYGYKGREVRWNSVWRETGRSHDEQRVSQNTDRSVGWPVRLAIVSR